MQALGSFARAAVTGALATLGHVAADEHAPPVRVPAVAETGYVGANAICAAANKQFDEYLNRRTTKARGHRIAPPCEATIGPLRRAPLRAASRAACASRRLRRARAPRARAAACAKPCARSLR